MLLSEIAGKEIVNLHDGAKLGLVGDSDIKININGKIEALIITPRSGYNWLFGRNNDREGAYVVVPWKAIKKIGSEVIIVDIDYAEYI
ncbi:MAG: YlmC/YmxH family sporulation protein [Peptococcaceae bacterium]|jgi:YlmC/YmxH family sporulation protein|nr:YlmC/YmxH family sporulation protein [Peptococcaceae bacterium]